MNISQQEELVSHLALNGCGITLWDDSPDHRWNALIFECHLSLKSVDPDYKILQIKEKVGQLRYYFSTTHKLRSARHIQMKESVRNAERQAATTKN